MLIGAIGWDYEVKFSVPKSEKDPEAQIKGTGKIIDIKRNKINNEFYFLVKVNEPRNLLKHDRIYMSGSCITEILGKKFL